MRILLVNKFFFPHRGAEKVFFDTIDLLKSHGHEVAVFSMRHPKNFSTEYEKYFVDYVDTKKLGIKEIFQLFKRFYSFEAARKIENLIQDFKPDIAYLHNIYHQISPSILPVLKKYNIPVVMSLHDYKIVCPSYHLNQNGKRCPKNKWLHSLYCIVFRHHKNSFIASIGVAAEWLFYKVLRIYEKNIDLAIAPSQYVYKQFVAYGWHKEKIRVVPHFTFINSLNGFSHYGEYVLYVGDSSPEKGLDLFMETARLLPQIPFVAVGNIDNPPQLPNVRFLGYKKGSELLDIYKKSSLVFVPTRAQESFGLVVLEAGAQGIPVLASNLGAIPELIVDGQNGFLFNPFTGGAQEAANIIRRLWQDKGQIAQASELAYKNAQNYSPENHYQNLMQIFSELSTKGGI